MSDVHKSGPHGGAKSSQPVTVDLTRIDIRRGTLYLPRRFYGALPEGELKAKDTASGGEMTVNFRSPRQLEGLAPFFEAHQLRPNDGVLLSLDPDLQITPVRRDRRHAAPNDRNEQEQAAAAQTVQEARVAPDRADERSEMSPRGSSDSGARRLAAPDGKSEPRLVAPPPHPLEGKGGWQNVLHDPTPRRTQPFRAQPADSSGAPQSRQPGEVEASNQSEAVNKAVRGHEAQPVNEVSRADAEPVKEAPRVDVQPVSEAHTADAEVVSKASPATKVPSRPHEAQKRPGDSKPSTPEGALDVGSGEAWHQAPRDLSRLGSGRLHGEQASEPRREREEASQRDPAQQGLFEEHTTRPEARPLRPQAPRQEQSETTGAAREAVTVGAPKQANAASRIASFLQDPSTPAIVRAAAVAESLGLPLEQVQQGLAEVARNSEGSVTPIRSDVYLVKRGK